MYRLFAHLRRHARWYLLLGSVVALTLVPYWQQAYRNPQLERIASRDFLTMVTRNAPTIYYQGRNGPSGFDYELMRRFADYLGVSLAVEVEDNIAAVVRAVTSGKGDIGAAALPLQPAQEDIHYSQPILNLQPLVIYRRGLPPVREIEDLIGKKLGIIHDSGIGELLRQLQQDWPALGWREAAALEVADLLQRVEDGRLDAAVVYRHQFKLNRLFFPGVEDGFPLGEPLSMAWVFDAGQGIGLQREANRFLDEMRRDGVLDALFERYFGHDDYLEYVGARTFIQQANARLEDYADLFRQAARDTGFDWKLLAAVGYQESHWNPTATSPTGVRGLMMLTNPTAKEVGVTNRLDAAQSIDGGARYLRGILDRLPESITGDDRLWMALAAYNVGLGHLYDARRLARQRGKNPDRWTNVREALPLLQKRQWYEQTRHGYARGGEPVIYVRNIRRYYEILDYLERSQRQYYQLEDRPVEISDNLPEDGHFDVVEPVL
ncbi:membrane-bound lytic murein transglycosylase MltF [Pistricoccus aurantiacus]|uniref:membrane-bound lytic murein transglycosylase MltF n=1 Tax=Pistricoccus aurantiacus TaxID=1883414 RepID=UPI00362E6A2F